MSKTKKCIVMYSGGLDSRLAVKMMQEQGFEVEGVHFKLPFGCGCCNLMCNFGFTQRHNVKMTIFDCTKGDLLKEYLAVLKKPMHGVGAGVNPCRDCKIFMFKRAKEYADKQGIDLIVTGEVLGERPLSQTKVAMDLIDSKIGFEILRPLSAKAMKPTKFEEDGIVDRSKFSDIVGRRREKQMALAEKFNIRYPTPGGGCLLCEKLLMNRFIYLLDKDLITEKTLLAVSVGRHFVIDGNWFVVSRRADESTILEALDCDVIDSDIGTPAVFYNNPETEDVALRLQKAYKDRKPDEFKEFKI